MQAEHSDRYEVSQWIKVNGYSSAQESSSGEEWQADILMHNKRRPTTKNVLTLCIQMNAFAYYKLNPKFQLGVHELSYTSQKKNILKKKEKVIKDFRGQLKEREVDEANI